MSQRESYFGKNGRRLCNLWGQCWQRTTTCSNTGVVLLSPRWSLPFVCTTPKPEDIKSFCYFIKLNRNLQKIDMHSHRDLGEKNYTKNWSHFKNLKYLGHWIGQWRCRLHLTDHPSTHPPPKDVVFSLSILGYCRNIVVIKALFYCCKNTMVHIFRWWYDCDMLCLFNFPHLSLNKYDRSKH